MNVDPGVTAAQAFHLQFEPFTLGGGDPLQGEADIGVDPAGAAHVDLAILFGVGVQQDLPFQPAGLQTEGAGHAGLFVRGQQHFQRAVLDGLVGQHGQTAGHAHAVVGTQGGATGGDPFTVDIGIDRVLGEVVLGIGVGLGNHVDVGLQHHGLAVFHPRRGRLLDDDVAHGVLFDRQAFSLGPLHYPGAQLGLVLGGVGDGADLLEELPNQFGRQRTKLCHVGTPYQHGNCRGPICGPGKRITIIQSITQKCERSAQIAVCLCW